MIQPNRRSATFASLLLGCVALGAFQESQASPIAYQFQIASDTWTCGRLRPAGQPCPTALNGTLTVDSAQTGFTNQFVDFTLPMGSFVFGRDQLSASGLLVFTEFRQWRIADGIQFPQLFRARCGWLVPEFLHEPQQR